MAEIKPQASAAAGGAYSNGEHWQTLAKGGWGITKKRSGLAFAVA